LSTLLRIAPSLLLVLLFSASAAAQDVVYDVSGTVDGEPINGRARTRTTKDALHLTLWVQRASGKEIRYRGSGRTSPQGWRFDLNTKLATAPDLVVVTRGDDRLAATFYKAGERVGSLAGPRAPAGATLGKDPPQVSGTADSGHVESERRVIKGRVGTTDLLGHHLEGKELPRPEDRVVELSRVVTPSRRGKKAGWWDGWLNTDLTITEPLGTYASRADAIRACQGHEGPGVVLQVGEGYEAHGIDDHSSYALTLRNVEQARGYPVTNLRHTRSEVGKPSALVLEDSAVLRPSRSRFSRTSFTVDGVANRAWNADRTADELYLSMSGAGTDEARLFEALASLPPEERPHLAQRFNAKYEDRGGDLDSWLEGDMSNVVGSHRLAKDMIDSTGTILSRAEMRRQFKAALDGYKGDLSDSSSVLDVPRLTWFLGNPGNVIGAGTHAAFTTGNEYALKQAIERESKRRDRRLSPGEVYALALDLNGGDTYLASLNAHNTMRGLARGMDPAWNDQVPKGEKGRILDWFGNSSQPEFVRQYLQPIRGGNDESGAIYHLFGMSTMSMAGGETAADGMASLEEYTVSKDAWSDPFELRIDRMGAELGQFLER
jgi:hypothetical protein